MNGNEIYLEPTMIINIVAKHFKLLPEDIICTKRKREFIKAKHIAMFFCKQFTDYTLGEIGEKFNGRDHSTIIHAIQSVNDQADIYKAYKNDLNIIFSKLAKAADNEFEKYKFYETEKV